ncbi:AtzG-like protein [Sphingobium sp. CCH11-B1]|jgi:sodium/bile acid cotransporter 7|uniref:AtzG-like protein n=1 Tax=Sphingobium sp. CCH11-B1 TaxID=1768781 RepID=UPI000AD6553F|nr:AtzG-like protein [Sphingobium sp. CCH11-B1]MEA3389292.1 AtzG-like protein [Pseudomonadota bacterium]
MAETPPPAIPLTDEDVFAAAATLDLPILAACMPGVLANLALLDRHARTLLTERGAECE